MSKKCTPLWCETHFQVKIHKAHHSRTNFGSCDVCDVEKVHAVVARSALPSQNVESTPFPDHLEVEMSKKCTPLGRESHVQVKSVKICSFRTTFGRSDVVSCGMRKGLCTLSEVSKTRGFCSSFSYYNHQYTTQHYTTLHSIPLDYTKLRSIILQLQLHYANCTPPQLQFHYATATTTVALHHTTSSSCD